MSVSEGKDKEVRCERGRQNLIVVRREKMRLAPTMRVEAGGLMGDLEDEGGEEGQ